jgi:sugar/nucleoside kinase (ribokinase family)
MSTGGNGGSAEGPFGAGPAVFGIGNPLIDVVIQATDNDLGALELDKGIMHLVTEERQREILDYFSEAPRTYRPGGAAPNTLIALAGLGIPSVVCGKIGDDEFGQTYNEQVAAYGITSRLMQGSGATGSSIILVTPDGERTMNTHLGMCQEFGTDDLDEELLRRSRFLYFTGYMWDTEVQKAAIRRALTVAHDAGVTVAFDLADPFAVERYREDFLQLLEDDVDIVFANRTEARILYGTPAATEAAGDPAGADRPDDDRPGADRPAAEGPDSPEDSRRLAEELGRHVRIAALKVGKDGSLVAERAAASSSDPAGAARHDAEGGAGADSRGDGAPPKVTAVPGRPIRAVDSTGAGDMFAAGFLAALAQGRDAVHASRAAGWLAEEIIQLVGAQFTVDHITRLRGELATTTE